MVFFVAVNGIADGLEGDVYHALLHVNLLLFFASTLRQDVIINILENTNTDLIDTLYEKASENV